MSALQRLVTIVTGGSSGLGKATVERLLTYGGRVINIDKNELKTQDFIEKYSEQYLFVKGDVCSESDVKNALTQVKDKFGQLDCVVNCAGIAVAFQVYNFNKKKEHLLEDFQRVIEVNTVGTFNVTRLAVGLIGQNEPNKDGQRGILVNTACISAFDGQKGQAAYAASKAAIVGMTLPLARDLSKVGIRVVTLAPGIFDTPISDVWPVKLKEFFGRLTLSPSRLGKPEEFAQLVTSVIENPLLNGEVIRIDGGLRLSLS